MGPKDKDERAPVLPSKLLAGGALRLQDLYLRNMSYPALPKLLLSARDLVNLCFTNIPSTCSISPGEILTGLDGLTRLQFLTIEFQPSVRLNLLTDQRLTAPVTPTVRLPSLKNFCFKGYCEYLEGLVAQIDAPRVTYLNIYYFSQPVYQVLQLAQFLVRSEYLTPRILSSLAIRLIPWIQFGCCGERSNLHFQIDTSGMVRGVLHSVQLLQQLSATFSGIRALTLVGPSPASAEPPFGGSLYGGSRFAASLFGETLCGRPLLEIPGVQDSIEYIDWIGLLRPFTGVNKLYLRGELSENVINALELVQGDMVAKILPALHRLQFVREQPPPTVSVDRFVSIRQNAGRPVTIAYPDDYEERENNDDEDEDEDDE
ncbi:hypothetical protein EI94DRAFT_867012 [Lactarius quietus]|nr:hypothetical protein EI94DRAFT_867012 [Lactarius quietus]